MSAETTSPPTATLPADLETALATYRVELTGYCYRMLGSGSEADDAMQEVMIRSWKAYDRFEGRSSLRTWLHRIATNVCLDALRGRQRRAMPMDMGPASVAPVHPGDALPDSAFVLPVPDARVLPDDGDPADLAVERESLRLAFVATLQHLPPRQRAVLILCEVLRWHADEVAALLDTTVASVNSALQRARATLAERQLDLDDASPVVTADHAAVAARYLDAFERYDMDALRALLHDEVTMSMPPYSLWLRGPDEVEAWMLGAGAGCRGSRLVGRSANGMPAFAAYKPNPETGELEPFSLAVLEITDGAITGLTYFLEADTLFPLFDLPPRFEAA